MTRSAEYTGLEGESYCHEASGAPATPGEPTVQADRPRGPDQVWGAGRARVSPFCSPPVPPVTTDLSHGVGSRGRGGRSPLSAGRAGVLTPAEGYPGVGVAWSGTALVCPQTALPWLWRGSPGRWGQAEQELPPRILPQAAFPELAGSPLPWQQGQRTHSPQPAQLEYGASGSNGARRPRAAGLAAIETPVGGEGQDQRLKGWQGAWPSNRCITPNPAATRPLLTGSAPRPPQGAPAQEGGDRRLKQVRGALLEGTPGG